MARKKLSKKEAGATSTEIMPDLPIGTEEISTKQPVKVVADETDPKQEAVNELRATLNTMRQGEDPCTVIWQFSMLGGGVGGSTIKFYQDCKENEILTGEPCKFVDPIAPAVSRAPEGNFAPLGGSLKSAKPKKNCPTC